MTTFKTIVTGIAFSPNLKANIFETLRLAFYLDAKVIFVHVGNKTDDKEKDLQHYFNDFPNSKNKIEVVFKEGNPVEVILDSAREFKADLLILGAAQRENILKFYLGSIARKIAKKAECSLLLLIKPTVEQKPCNHIVVNGLENPNTKNTILSSFCFAKNIGATKMTIVEEIDQNQVDVKIDDDKSLEKSTLLKEKIIERENSRVEEIIKDVDENFKQSLIVKTQSIFGKRGYSIGHYAKIHRADLLIMNKPEKPSLLDKIFPRDIDYILAELPTDVLIIN